MIELRTERLVLRAWRYDDLEPFAAMNADPCVMEHFPSVLSPAESDATAGRIRAHFEQRGYGLWAVEVPDEVPFAGFVGLHHVPFDAHFTPAVEIGWRLAASVWGRGYATEGARAAVSLGFDTLGLEEIVSMTVSANRRSWNVMHKLGMTRDPRDDFEHPRVPEGSPLRRHILHRLRREAWAGAASKRS